METLIVRGSLHEVRIIHEEIATNYGDSLVVGEIRESNSGDIFSPGRLGESPVVSFLIQYGADVAAAGTVGLVAALRKLIKDRRTPSVEIEEPPPATPPEGADDSDDTD